MKTEMVYRSLGGKSLSERIGLGFMRKGARYVDDTSDHYSLVYCLEGRSVYRDSDGARELSAGMIFQRVPGWEHTTSEYKDWLECFVALPAVLYDSLHALDLVPGTPSLREIGLHSGLAARFEEGMTELRDVPEQKLSAMIGTIVTLLTDTLAAVHSGRDVEMVEVACQALGSRLASRFNLPLFCEERGWGYERFRKVFFRHMGISPGQYRIRRRIDQACQLLHDEGRSISDIAAELGYPSAYEFSGQFKKQTGMPPSRYRRRG